MKIRKYIHNYKTKGSIEVDRRKKLYKNTSHSTFKNFSKAIFYEPPGDISNEQFDDTIWYEAYCNSQIRTMWIPKEIILDFLYNNGYKELFEDEESI